MPIRSASALGAALGGLLALATGPVQAIGAPPPAAVMAAGGTTQTIAQRASPAWVAFARAWNHIAGYRATVTVFEQKGTQVQNMVLDYSFRKPSNASIRIVKGPDTGVTLIWNGGDTLEAHRGCGFIGLFKRTLSLRDPLATTVRGSSIDQLSFGAILAHGMATPGAVSQAAGAAIDGTAMDAVRLVPANPTDDASLTLEIIYISKQTHLPVLLVGYEGPKLVRSVEFSSVELER